MDDSYRVLGLALGVRVLAVAVTSLTALNPDSSGDVMGFAAVASTFASAVLSGRVPAVNFADTFDAWGIFLAPFWVLPGPSVVYARSANAFLGAFAAYNVYLIASQYHSRRAGIFAAAPLIFYPSVLAIQATILREAIILFGLTTVARLYYLSEFDLATTRHLVAALLLAIATLHRPDNLPVYLLVFAVAFLLSRTDFRETRMSPLLSVLAIPLFVWAYPKITRVLGSLATLRRNRATGRTAYLTELFPETIPTAAAFSWVGAAYFLFTPFPWMVATPLDAIVAIEAATNICYSLAAVGGVRVLAHRAPARTTALAVGIVVGSVLYGFGTANVGTAVRHRQMVLWAIFLLGGIGIANTVSIVGYRRTD